MKAFQRQEPMKSYPQRPPMSLVKISQENIHH